MTPKFTVTISGAGIGGFALAAFLCQHSKDIKVDIYETKGEVSTMGAVIAIWKRSWQVLQDLGLEPEVRKRKLPLPKDGEARGPLFRKADQPEGVDFHNHMMPYGPTSLPRPVLLDLLQSRFTDMCNIYTSKHILSYEQSPGGPITIKFKDGSTTTTDILVGCDGVHSDTRATMYRDFAEADPSQGYEKFCEPKWSGMVAYRGMVQKAKLNPDHQALFNPKIWCGSYRHVVSNPFGGIVHLVCYNTEVDGYGKPFDAPWVADVSPQEVIDCYKGWEPDLVNLVKLIENPSRWSVHLVQDLPHSVSGRVALLGDAAHAMTPHQGVGGGQAIEDAHLLGRLLAHEQTTLNNVAEVLAIYQDIRLPQSKKAADLAWNNGLIYEFMHPDYQVKPDASAEELKPCGTAVGSSFAWLGKGGCYEDWSRAEERLLQLQK